MGKKNDMLVDYERTERRRGKRGRRKLWLSIVVIIFIIGLGLSAYIITKPSTKNHIAKDNQGENTENFQLAAISPDANRSSSPTTEPASKPKNKPTSSPNGQPTSGPTTRPTSQPVKEATDDSLEYEKQSVYDTEDSIKGIYVPASTAGSDKIDQLIDIAGSTEINAMVIDVKDDRGRISYSMDCKMAKQIGATTNTIPDIHSLVKTLKSKNIYLIARIVAFKDPYLAKKRSDLAVKNKDGSIYIDSNGDSWVNPYNTKVWDYLLDVSAEAAKTGFDEIQFDYIRFSTGKSIANADFGEEAKSKSKEQVILDFTKYAYKNLKPLGVMISADVFGTIISSKTDAELVGQNYVEMSKYLDYICPMIYPSHYSEGNFGIQYPDMEPFKVISKVLSISAKQLNSIPKGVHHAVVRPWLQDFTATWINHHLNYGGEEIREEIEGVYSVGYGEWLLWNAKCVYSEDGLRAD